MNTFLPYRDFVRSARCLDDRRLGKQRLEALIILRVLNGELNGWRNHPAVKMWNGYTEALVEYGCVVCDEWVQRGFTDNLKAKIRTYSWGGEVVIPHWLTPAFCKAHRSNLVRKNPEHYRKLFPNVPENIPYIWGKGLDHA